MRFILLLPILWSWSFVAVSAAIDVDRCERGFDGCYLWSPEAQAAGVTWQKAVGRAKRRLLISPGEYNIVTAPYIAGRDSLSIIGTGKVTLRAGKPLGTFIGYGGTNKGTLRVENIHLDGGWKIGNCIYAGSAINKQHIVLKDVELYRCGHGLMGANEHWNGRDAIDNLDDSYLLDNVDCHASTSHCIYIDRSAKAVVRNSRFYDPGNGKHALKVISWEIDLHDNQVSNAMLDGSASRATGNATLSLVSCQIGRVVDNILVFRYDRGGRPKAGGTGGNVLDKQPRWVLSGCDKPPYQSQTNWSETYWEDKSRRYVTEVSGNTFRLFGDKRERVGMRLVVNQGTVPMTTVVPGNTLLKTLPRPAGWYERSIAHVHGNHFEGAKGGRWPDRVCVSKYWGQLLPEARLDPPLPKPVPKMVDGPDCAIRF